jgi:hypothetical protein
LRTEQHHQRQYELEWMIHSPDSVTMDLPAPMRTCSTCSQHNSRICPSTERAGRCRLRPVSRRCTCAWVATVRTTVRTGTCTRPISADRRRTTVCNHVYNLLSTPQIHQITSEPHPGTSRLSTHACITYIVEKCVDEEQVFEKVRRTAPIGLLGRTATCCHC